MSDEKVQEAIKNLNLTPEEREQVAKATQLQGWERWTYGDRKVGPLLGIGILFLPIVFSWFTLRWGHTTLSRAVAFGWLTFWLLMPMGGQ